MARVVVLVLFFIIYVVAANILSPYPKGSDQYWNVGNVDRVVNVDGKYKTNHIYPASLPATNADLPRPWVQNRPIVYVVTWIGFLVSNAQQAWILANCIFLFLSAIILYKILKRENTLLKQANRSLIILLSCLFLVYPFNFYQSMQALGEIFNQFLVIAIFYLLVSKPNNYGTVAGVSLLTGMLIFQRENYVLLIILMPLYFLVFSQKSQKFYFTFLFIIITAFLFLMKPFLLPSHTIHPLNFFNVLTKERYGQSTMSAYLYSSLPAQSIGESFRVVFGRVAYAIKAQFSISKSISIFFYLINILFIPYLLLLFKFRKLPVHQRKGLFLVTIFIVTHFITVSLYQNQYRFAAILIPLLTICCYWFIQNNKKYETMVMRMLIALVPLFIIVNAFIGLKNRRESLKEHSLVSQVLDAKRTSIQNTPVFIDFTADQPWTIGYALSPNLCYFFPGDTDIDDLVRASTMLKTNLFFIQKNTDFYNRIKNTITAEQLIDKERNIVLATISLPKP